MFFYYYDFLEEQMRRMERERIREDRAIQRIHRILQQQRIHMPRKFCITTNIFSGVPPHIAFDCPICLDSEINPKELIRTACKHDVCKTCFQQSLDTLLETDPERRKKPCCSLCRAEIKQVSFVNTEYMEQMKTKYFTVAEQENTTNSSREQEESDMDDDVSINIIEFLV